MPRGRPPLPDSVRQLRGTHRSDRHGDPATKKKPSGIKPTVPSSFSAEQKRVWNSLNKKLEPLGLWSSEFSDLVELYCRTYVRYLELERYVKKHGPILESPRLDNNSKPVVIKEGKKTTHITNRKTNPAQAKIVKLLPQLRGMLSELGLSPSSLSKIQEEVGKASLGDSSELRAVG